MASKDKRKKSVGKSNEAIESPNDESSDSLVWELDESKGFQIIIPEPPEIVRLGLRFVLIKVGDKYMRHNMSSNLVITSAKPPIVPPIEPGIMPGVRFQYPCRVTKDFVFENYTFCMEENIVATKEEDEVNVRHRTQANFSVLVDRSIFMVCALSNAQGGLSVALDSLVYGSDWRLHAISKEAYVMENVQYKGCCLALNRFGLCMERLSANDWILLETGVCKPHRRVTITNIPDFAVTAPGVFIF